MSNRTHNEYTARINRVMDYVDENIHEELSLEKLSEIACFSPFHFHRIFKAMTGETLNQFIQRVRMHKAAGRIANDPSLSITDIAYEYGFSSSAHFSRSFKDFFGVTPTEWREGRGEMQNSKISQMISKEWKAPDFELCYDGFINLQQHWRIKMNSDKKDIQVTVKPMKAVTIAYVRNVGPYKGDSALFERLFNQLCMWAGPRGLIKEGTRFFSCYHDNPELTDEDKLRLSVGLSVDENCEVDGEIGKLTIPAGTYGLAYVEAKESTDFEQAWQAVYGKWLPESGYQPDDTLFYEEYLNDPKSDPEGLIKLNIGIPVKPL